jgi:hypothetical protein
VKEELPSEKVIVQGLAPVKFICKLAEDPAQKLTLPPKLAEEAALMLMAAEPDRVPAPQKSLAAIPE